MSSLHTTGWRAFQPITFAIIKDGLWLNSRQIFFFFSVNAGDKSQNKTGGGVLLSSDCQDLPFYQLLNVQKRDICPRHGLKTRKV